MRPKSIPLSVRSPSPDPKRAHHIRIRQGPPPTRSRLRDILATIPIVLLVPAIVVPLIVTQARSPSLEVQGPAVAEQGVTILGRGFRPSDRVELVWTESEAIVASVAASKAGRFSATFQLPRVSPGSYTVSATVTAPRPARSPGLATTPVASVEVIVVDGVPPTSAEPSISSLSTPLPLPSSRNVVEPIDATAPPVMSSSPEPTVGPSGTRTASATLPPAATATAAPAVTSPAPPAPPPAPTPMPIATPAPAPPAPAGSLLFVADAETGDASQWCFVHSAVPVGTVTSPVRAGQYAFKAEVQDGAIIYDSERSEYANGPGDCSGHRFREGDETWTAVSILPQEDFPVFSHWSLIVQWKEPFGGTPSQQINLQDDVLAIVGAGSINPRPRFNFGIIQRGAWTDLLIHHKWSPDSNVGFVEVFVNGQLALPLTNTKTMENSNPLFLSVGHYRDLAPTTGTSVLYFDEVRVGTSRASVAQ